MSKGRSVAYPNHLLFSKTTKLAHFRLTTTPVKLPAIKIGFKVDFSSSNNHMSNEKAILAGGCFWGMEELIRTLPGVTSTVVGYTGGDVKNATYRNHGTHAEAIAITFDPEQLSYGKLLKF